MKTVPKEKRRISENLANLALEATDVVLWLDCDREGEAICFEVLEELWKVNKGLKVHRARFSALTREDVEEAVRELGEVDEKASEVSGWGLMGVGGAGEAGD